MYDKFGNIRACAGKMVNEELIYTQAIPRQSVKALSLFSGILVSIFVPFTLECLRMVALMFIIVLEVSNGYSDY